MTKKVQELYALINYGEMRRKIPLDNQKVFMKLRELVYRGSVTVRAKGKNCRIKTPSCPALRKINQVESELCVNLSVLSFESKTNRPRNQCYFLNCFFTFFY